MVARQSDWAAGFFCMFQFDTTAAAFSGVPSLNFRPGRSVIVHTVSPAFGVTDCASRGTTFSVTGSTVASELYTSWLNDCAGVPYTYDVCSSVVVMSPGSKS